LGLWESDVSVWGRVPDEVIVGALLTSKSLKSNYVGKFVCLFCLPFAIYM